LSLLRIKISVGNKKTIPYSLPMYEIIDCMWSSCERSSTPRIMSIEEDVVYPWEIDVAVNRMLDFQARKLASTRQTMCPLRTRSS